MPVKMRSAAHAIASVYLLAMAAEARAAPGDEDKAACMAAYEQGQVRRKENRLLEARTELTACSQEGCPELARRDCFEWLHQLETAIPSIVVGARSTSGSDVVDATLTVDERLVQPRLTGAPFQLDPGTHRIVVRGPGDRTTEQTIAVRPGERNRLVSFVVADAAPTPASPPASAPRSRQLAWFVGAAGAVVLGGGIVFDLVGSSDLQNLRRDCAPRCQPADVDQARGKIIVGDVLLAAGVGTILAAVYLAFRQPSGRPASAPATAW